MKHLKNLLNDESGATAIEYGLIAALISIAIVVTVRGLGGNLDAVFQRVDQEVTNIPN